MGKHSKPDNQNDNQDNHNTPPKQPTTKFCGIHGPYSPRHGNCPSCSRR